MITTKEIDVIPNTNNGIVREVINAMFWDRPYSRFEALKTARWNYYKSKQNDFGSDIFIIFKLNNLIFEVEGRWYGNEDEECWFSAYNWYCDIKEKPTDWDYNHIQFENPYDFKRCMNK